MGFLSNGSLAIANNHALSCSVWMRIPSVTWNGDPNFFRQRCSIFRCESAFGTGMFFQVDANQDIFSNPGVSTIGFAGNGVAGNWNWASDGVSQSFIGPDKWFLIQLSVDWSAGLFYETSPPQAPASWPGTVLVVVNGVQVANAGFPNPPPHADNTQVISGLPSGNVMQMAFSGKAFGVPQCFQNIAFPDFPGRAEYAYFQLWTGLALNFLDPGVAAGFYSVSGGVATPKSVTVAASMFGQQQVCFTGRASDGSFYVNQGTGGNFVLTGTATNFSPAPSYGP